jgi:hypothetical protein
MSISIFHPNDRSDPFFPSPAAIHLRNAQNLRFLLYLSSVLCLTFLTITSSILTHLLFKPGRFPFSGNPNPYIEEVEWQQEE